MAWAQFQLPEISFSLSKFKGNPPIRALFPVICRTPIGNESTRYCQKLPSADFVSNIREALGFHTYWLFLWQQKQRKFSKQETNQNHAKGQGLLSMLRLLHVINENRWRNLSPYWTCARKSRDSLEEFRKVRQSNFAGGCFRSKVFHAIFSQNKTRWTVQRPTYCHPNQERFLPDELWWTTPVSCRSIIPLLPEEPYFQRRQEVS